MKKAVFGLLIMMTILALVFSACTSKTTTTTPASTPASTPTTSQAPQVIELVFNDHNPPPTGPAQAYDYWAQKVMEESNGRLKITVIHGGALFTGDEVYKAVKSGACAGGHYVLDREDGFLLNLIMTLPFMGWPEQHVEGKFQTLLDEYPEMMAEWEGVTILHYMMMPPTHVHTVSKVIKTPADIKGVKIFCAEAILAEIMNAVGATAVEAGIMDMTPDVQTGLVEGVFNHFPVLKVFGTLELTKCHTIFGAGGINITPMFTVMNTKVLNGLPSDLKDIILKSGHYWFDKFKELDNADIAAADAYVKENNHTITYLTAEEVKVWYDMVKQPIHDAFVQECEAKGLPGQKLYDRALKLTTGN